MGAGWSGVVATKRAVLKGQCAETLYTPTDKNIAIKPLLDAINPYLFTFAVKVIKDMRIHFSLRYSTQYGEACYISINDAAPQALEYLNESAWHGSFEFDPAQTPSIGWRYQCRAKDGTLRQEWDHDRLLHLADFQDDLAISDVWNATGNVENAFYTQPFRDIFFKQKNVPTAKKESASTSATHIFKVKAPALAEHESVCLLGHGIGLRNWDTAAPLLLRQEGAWWTIRLNLSQEHFPLGYKYGVWNNKTNRFIAFEEGSNRVVYANQAEAQQLIFDGFVRMPLRQWKGSGVAIPVFSLRTAQSWGSGEFTDLKTLVDWAKSVGLKLIQLLPVNDTTATKTWTDSYPYAAISAFALHPIFLNVAAVAGKKHEAVLKPYSKEVQKLNALDVVDYEEVMRIKWDVLRQLYDLLKADWLKDKAYQAYYAANKHWLAPYSVFCWLRDVNGSSDFNLWTSHGTYKEAEIEKLLEPKSKYADAIGLHLFVQWQLHLQLKAAADYAHDNGIALKGDIPIGIYRYSCDAWVAPELYNMNNQAGAPPDDFAEKGQNWGFPTYNWSRMKADGFAWWRQRFEQMSLYFDAFRIDHILGFFRIWSIPLDAVEGILGAFVPAIPITVRELREAGVGFDHDRLCKPYITEQVLYQLFGKNAAWVAENCLSPRKDGRYDLLPAFDTQRKVEAYFHAQEPTETSQELRDGLYELIANVILLPVDSGATEEEHFAFRFGIEKTASFKALDSYLQERLKALYVNYFYRRQDDFWQREAMEKLPDLKRSTNMLICGEDLGMVPHCVPDVMKDLSILSLEIQRMPKASGSAFFHPKDAPYLSVVTPSTHDMSTLRGWWEEDRSLTQRFYNEILQQHGDAPWFCEPWVNRILLEQHFHSPAMWAIFQLQDLMGMDGVLRRENPNDERINVPANPKHYWRYRMHLSLEDLMKKDGFNGELRRMVRESGR